MKDYWARLRTTLPPDAIDDGDREIRQGGLGLLAVVAETWISLGFGRPQIIDSGDHGWSQFSKRDQIKVWSQVTWFGDDLYLLGVSDCSPDLRRMNWKRFRDEILVPFNETLRTDSRLTEVNWIDPHDIMDEGGAYSPSDPSLPVNRSKGFWIWRQ
jgi:hypothetical protein